MGNAINPNMIVLARESRGMTQIDLAAKIGMTPTNLSKIERSDIGISPDIAAAIADATRYPETFFTQSGTIVPENLSYRKRETVAQKIITPIAAKVNIVRMQVQRTTRLLNIPPATLPAMEVSDDQPPAAVAKELRKRWSLKDAVIDNVTAVVEDRGIVVTGFDFGTERVDSRSVLTEDKCPIIILNSLLLGDKQRFSLAYQLGQLVMHTGSVLTADRDIAHEANLFAAEFLMPEKAIRKDFDAGISLPLLGELKLKWKVSMISLLYRADDLGYLTPNQKRYMLQQFNQLGIRRREPLELDVPVEHPKLLRRLVAELKSANKYDTAAVAAALNLTTQEFLEVYS